MENETPRRGKARGLGSSEGDTTSPIEKIDLWPSDPLPEPWRCPTTRQSFAAWGRWSKPDVELVDWQTNCRECGTDHCFVLRADYPKPIIMRMSLKWHGLCTDCRKEMQR